MKSFVQSSRVGAPTSRGPIARRPATCHRGAFLAAALLIANLGALVFADAAPRSPGHEHDRAASGAPQASTPPPAQPKKRAARANDAARAAAQTPRSAATPASSPTDGRFAAGWPELPDDPAAILDPQRVALRNADGELLASYLAWSDALDEDLNDRASESSPHARLRWRPIWTSSGVEPTPRTAPTNSPIITPLAPGDADADGTVGQHDAALVLSEWGSASAFGIRGDLNANGTVGLDDLVLIVERWSVSIVPTAEPGIIDIPPPYFPCWCCPPNDCLVACLPPSTCADCCGGTGGGPHTDPTDDNPDREPRGDDDDDLDNPGGGGSGDPPDNGGGGGVGDPPGGTDCDDDGDCDGICDPDDCDSLAYTGSPAACEDDDLDEIKNQNDLDSPYYRRPRPGVDIRIDSNNDGSVNDADEDEENRPGSLGHIVRAGDGDHDGDGIPDHSDGFDAFECAECDDDDESPGSRFVPLKLFVRSGSLNDGKIAIDYAASDPAEVGAGGSSRSSGGGLRLWKKDGSQRRNKLPIVAPERGNTGDYIPPGSYEPNDLGLSAHGGEVTLYLEVIRLSSSPADLVISASAQMSACGDSAKLTSYRVAAVGITEEGVSGSLQHVPLSHPSPTIALAQVELTNLRPSEDFTRLLADIVVSGTIDDAASDLIDGAAGVIDSVQLLVNGEPPITPGLTRGGIIPEYFIDVTTDKIANPQSVLKPFDYSGSFARIIPGVEVQPGMNEIKIVTTNAYGYAGSAERGAEVLAIPPPDEDYHISIETFGNDPYGSKGYPIVVTLTINGVAEQATLEATAPGVYEAQPEATALFGMIVRFVPGSVLTPGQVDEFIARVTIPDTLVQDEEILFIETGPDTNTITGDTFVEEAMRPDWRAYQILPGQLTPISATGPGQLNAFGLRFEGPEELKDLLQSATVNTLSAGPRTYQIVEFGGHHLLANPMGEKPAAWLALASTPLVLQDLEPEENDGFWQMVQGFGMGICDTGVGIFDGVVAIGKGAWYIATNYNTISVGWRLLSEGEFFTVEDRERIAIAGQIANALVEVLQDIRSGELNVVAEMMVGSEGRINAFGDQNRLIGQIIAELWHQMLLESADMTAFEIGRVAGRVWGEAAVAIASLGGVTAATKAVLLPRIVAKLRQVPFLARIFARNPQMLVRAEAVAQRSVALAEGGGCFLAGTPVLTATGSVPIESVCPGDLVVSRELSTGELGLRRVVRVSRTVSSDFVKVEVRDSGWSAEQPCQAITCTAEHPFYLEMLGRFVAAEELRVGDVLNAPSCDASSVFVTDVRPVSGSSAWVYNFEVEDWHTYFVGDEGTSVWVHNSSKLEFETLYEFFDRIRRETGETGHVAEDLKRALDQYTLAKGRAPEAENVLRGVDYVMTRLYAQPPRLPDGSIDWPKMSYTYLKGLLGDYLSPNDIDAHHAAVRYVVKAIRKNLGRPEPSAALLDSMPAFLLNKKFHRGAAEDGVAIFHRILEQYLPPGGIPPTMSSQQIIDQLALAYREFGREDVGDVAIQWIREVILPQ